MVVLPEMVCLQVFCGMLDRMWQFSDILRHSRGHSPATAQVILGDLNTMGHGVARLSPNYCCDPMRWRSLGSSEARYWSDHVLAVKESAPVTSGADLMDVPRLNLHLLHLGLPPRVCADILNPGFEDPFDPDKDPTLDNPKYRLFGVSLMTGKLDWVLLKNMEVVRKELGNHDYLHSDHKWLMVEVNLK